MSQGGQYQTLIFIKKLFMKQKQVVNSLVFTYFGRPRHGYTIKVNFISFQTVDREILSILIFYKRFWNQLLHHILCMIFTRKIFLILYSIIYYTYAILYSNITDQISLSGCLYFQRYWEICVLQLFIVQSVASFILKLTIPFLWSRFSTQPKSQDKNVNTSE